VKKYRFKPVYQNISDELQQEIVSLWLDARVLTSQEAKRRVPEVVLTVRNSKKELVGVTTAYTREFIKPGNFYYYMRMFVKPAERRSFEMLEEAYRRTYQTLSKAKSTEIEVQGVVLEMENVKFTGKGAINRLANLGPVFWGKNAVGQDVWYHRFDADPKKMN